MIRKLHKSIVLFSLLVFIISCNDNDEPNKPPAINFKSGAGYTADGSIVEVGGELFFGIQARASVANLTNFTIKKHTPDGEIITMMDTGMNCEVMDIEKIFYQSIEDTAEWVFSVMDKNRLSSSLQMTIYKDPESAYGGIYHYTGIKMGYQDNEEYGHFLDPFSGKVYFADSATMFQDNIHFLVYYIVDEDLPSPVFSSAGEMDNYSTEAQNFYPEIENWETRNFTLWDISVDDYPVSSETFDNAHNDSLLIVSYHEVWGKKKFKWATNGRVIPFRTTNGKFGMVKVVNADHTGSGTIEFDLKIQR